MDGPTGREDHTASFGEEPTTWPPPGSGEPHDLAGNLSKAPGVGDIASVLFLKEGTVLVAPNVDAGVFRDTVASTRFRGLVKTLLSAEHIVIDYSDQSGDFKEMRETLAILAMVRANEQNDGNPITVIDPKGYFEERLESLVGPGKILVVKDLASVLKELGVDLQDKDEAATAKYYREIAPAFEQEMDREIGDWNSHSKSISHEPKLSGPLTSVDVVDDEVVFHFVQDSLLNGSIPESGARIRALGTEVEILSLTGLAQDRKLVFDMEGVKAIGADTAGLFIKLCNELKNARLAAQNLEENAVNGAFERPIPDPDSSTVILRNASASIKEKLDKLGLTGFAVTFEE